MKGLTFILCPHKSMSTIDIYFHSPCYFLKSLGYRLVDEANNICSIDFINKVVLSLRLAFPMCIFFAPFSHAFDNFS